MEASARRRVTGKDVAAHAGLSRSTVSQVLNGFGHRFPVETRERVEAAARELGYRPSKAGRALVTGVSDIVVVVVPNVTFGHHLQDAIEEMARESASLGLSVVARFAGDDSEATVASLVDLNPAAVVDFGALTPALRSRLTDAGVLVVPQVENLADLESGDPNTAVARVQVAEMVRAPSRRLVYAMVSDQRQDIYGPARAQAIAQCAAEHGLEAPRVIGVPLDLEEATSALAPLADDIPLGICCYNDEVAIAVMAAARQLGLTVPEDVAVIGMDATEVGQLISPRLTTVRFDLAAVSRGIIDDLRVLRGGEPVANAAQHSALPIELVPGETS